MLQNQRRFVVVKKTVGTETDPHESTHAIVYTYRVLVTKPVLLKDVVAIGRDAIRTPFLANLKLATMEVSNERGSHIKATLVPVTDEDVNPVMGPRMSHAPRYTNVLVDGIDDVTFGRVEPMPTDIALFC